MMCINNVNNFNITSRATSLSAVWDENRASSRAVLKYGEVMSVGFRPECAKIVGRHVQGE